jgi:hypothetical protein
MTALDYDRDGLAPTLAEAIRDEYELSRPDHDDVVCPPDPAAICRHCGRTLAQHVSTTAPVEARTPDAAVCLDKDAFSERKAIRWLSFELADGQSLDCVHASFCEQCGKALCPEHSTGFTTCVDQAFTYHHLDCAHECNDCMHAVAEAADEDRAIEAWKGL